MVSRVRHGGPLVAALAVSALVSGCSDWREDSVLQKAGAGAPSAASSAAAGQPPRALTPSRPDCETVSVFAAGAAAGTVCVEDVAKHRLTVIDLSDDWTPRVFARDPATSDAPAYRAKYLELANQKNA